MGEGQGDSGGGNIYSHSQAYYENNDLTIISMFSIIGHIFIELGDEIVSVSLFFLLMVKGSACQINNWIIRIGPVQPDLFAIVCSQSSSRPKTGQTTGI